MKILANIKEILYDIFGYIFPGFIFLILLTFPLFFNQSICYYLLSNSLEIVLNNYKFILNLELTTLNIILLIIVSYILGHSLNSIEYFFNGTFNIFERLISKITFSFCSFFVKLYNILSGKSAINNLLNKYNFLDEMESDLLNKLKSSPNFFCYNLLNNQPSLSNRILITFATTLSRFDSHNNLIQKYIYKSRLYSSLKIVSILLLGDCVISILSLPFSIINLIPCVLFYLLYLIFKYENIRHNKLKKKECYLYLYTYINNLNPRNSN